VTVPFVGQDRNLADRAAALLESVGRHTPNSAVAVHSLAAAEQLDRRPAALARDAPGDERIALAEVLQLLAALSAPARRRANVAEALHQTMLAYLASR
jgi:hypothetical protein